MRRTFDENRVLLIYRLFLVTANKVRYKSDFPPTWNRKFWVRWATTITNTFKFDNKKSWQDTSIIIGNFLPNRSKDT